MKPIDKLEQQYIYDDRHTVAVAHGWDIENMALKLNQIISSHNELIKIINKLNKE